MTAVRSGSRSGRQKWMTKFSLNLLVGRRLGVLGARTGLVAAALGALAPGCDPEVPFRLRT